MHVYRFSMSLMPIHHMRACPPPLPTPRLVQIQRGVPAPLRSFLFTMIASGLGKSVPQGAASIAWAATSRSAVPGGYIADCAPAEGKRSRWARDRGLGARLWAESQAQMDGAAGGGDKRLGEGD